MQNLLEVKKLCKYYKDFELKDINFSLPKGYIMGYVGPNGAGKTTTLNMITHICKQGSGDIWINGMSYQDDPVGYKEKIGYIGDESFFPELMKICDIKKTLSGFYQTFDDEKFDQFIQRWELPQKKKITDFSRGMKVKLMFASALSRKTDLLILDEATNGLDPVMRNDILKLLQEYISDGEKSVLFSTHILSDLEQIADYVYFIDRGREVLSGTKDGILEQYLLVKGDLEWIGKELRQALIGIDTNSYGFTALLPSEQAELLDSRFVCEEPDIDQIVRHFIYENNPNREV